MTGQPKYQNIYVKADNYAPPKNFQGKESVQSVAGCHLGDNQGTGESATCSGTSVHSQAVSWWGLLFPGTSVSLSIYLPQTEHLPSMHLSGPGRPQVWWTGTSIHSADCEADVFTSGFL